MITKNGVEFFGKTLFWTAQNFKKEWNCPNFGQNFIEFCPSEKHGFFLIFIEKLISWERISFEAPHWVKKFFFQNNSQNFYKKLIQSNEFSRQLKIYWKGKIFLLCLLLKLLIDFVAFWEYFRDKFNKNFVADFFIVKASNSNF